MYNDYSLSKLSADRQRELLALAEQERRANKTFSQRSNLRAWLMRLIIGLAQRRDAAQLDQSVSYCQSVSAGYAQIFSK